MDSKLKHDPAETKIKARLADFLAVRRRYLKSALKTAELKAEGNEAFAALESEIRASLQVDPAKTKTKPRKE